LAASVAKYIDLKSDLVGKFEAVPILEEFYLYPDETSSLD